MESSINRLNELVETINDLQKVENLWESISLSANEARLKCDNLSNLIENKMKNVKSKEIEEAKAELGKI